MPIARPPRYGLSLALFTHSRRAALGSLVAVMVAIVLSCSNEPTDPAGEAPIRPPIALSVVGCEGCRRDPFIAPDGTLLENRLWGGDGASFAWVKTFGPTAFPDPAVIQNDAVGKTSQGFWRYITNALRADSIEIEVDVLGDIGSEAIQYDIGIVLRNTSADSGGFGGYTIFWSAFGNGAGAADAFITIDRPGASLLFEDDVPVPTPGTHTLGVAALAGGAINVYVDGVLTATAVDLAPLPPGRAGLTFGWAGTAPSGVWITTFAEGLHQRDTMTVNLESAEGPIWPSGLTSADGAAGPTELQLRVSLNSNDTTVKNKWVKLSLAAVDSAGQGSDSPYGHFHRGRGGIPKPTGKLDPKDSVNTGSDGLQGLFKYTSSQVSGPIVVRAEMEGALPDSLTIPVGVPGLVQLVPNGSFELVGVVADTHPSSNWVTSKMERVAREFADSFFTAIQKKVGFNDASLPFGGKFDLHGQWDQSSLPICLFKGAHHPAGCHQRHRVGMNLDLRIQGLSEDERTKLKQIWENVAGTRVGKEGSHFHVFRP